MLPDPVPFSDAELRRLFPRLVEVSLVLNSTLDLSRLLQFILEAATDVLNSEAASILLFDENTHELKFAAATGSDPAELAKIPVPIDRSIAGHIFTHQCPVIINDAQADPRLFRQVGEQMHFETRQLLGVPMRIQDRVTGVLEALNKRQGAFDETDSQTLSIIASYAAVAINNARLLQALQKAYDELGRLEKLKSDFMSIASHELRTPLGVVMGYATLIRDEATGELASFADSVLAAVSQMRTTIEEMTGVNYLRGESVELDMVEQDLTGLLRDACLEFAGRAQARGVKLDLAPPPEALIVNVDRSKVGMILAHLLDNAVRFTPGGGQVEVTAERRGPEAWVRVRDDGIGIEPGDLEKVFGEFYQVEDHMTRRHGGLGLGLSIVRGLARIHGGRVWAESPGLGGGATFTVSLPLAR